MKMNGWLLRAACGMALLVCTRAGAAEPDISGNWSTEMRVHASGFPLMGGFTDWIAVSKGDPSHAHVITVDEVGAAVDRSVREFHGNPAAGLPKLPLPPFNPAGRAVFAKINPKAMQDREVACYPANVLWRIGLGAMQVVQSSKAIAMIYDGALARTVYLDDRDESAALPQWNGHSVGHWDAGALKIRVTKIRGDAFGFANWPMTESATVDEEYRLSADGRQLMLRETFFDPTYYTEPVRRIVFYHRMAAGDEVLDYTCEEGKADMIEMVGKPHP